MTLPTIQPSSDSDPRHNTAQEKVKELFDVDPSWVKVEYGNKGLYPWEAGCTWYDEVPHIQLRKAFETKNRIFGFYCLDEILAHEYVHAVRAHLNGSLFEEMFAYRTSGSFRRIVGPLFEQQHDSLLFVIALCTIPLLSFFCPSLLFVAFALMAFFALRLFKRSWQFRRCLQNLKKISPKPLAVMIQLRDDEIILFSKLSCDQLKDYITKKIAKGVSCNS